MFDVVNKLFRDSQFAQYWGGRLEYHGVQFADPALTLQNGGAIARITTAEMEARNKAFRDSYFAEHWPSGFRAEDTVFDDPALVLQRDGLIPNLSDTDLGIHEDADSVRFDGETFWTGGVHYTLLPEDTARRPALLVHR